MSPSPLPSNPTERSVYVMGFIIAGKESAILIRHRKDPRRNSAGNQVRALRPPSPFSSSVIRESPYRRC